MRPRELTRSVLAHSILDFWFPDQWPFVATHSLTEAQLTGLQVKLLSPVCREDEALGAAKHPPLTILLLHHRSCCVQLMIYQGTLVWSVTIRGGGALKENKAPWGLLQMLV